MPMPRPTISLTWSSLLLDLMFPIFKTLVTDASAKVFITQLRFSSLASTTTRSLLSATSISKNSEKLFQLPKRQTMFPLGSMYASLVFVRKSSVLLLPVVWRSLSTLIMSTRLSRIILTWDTLLKSFLSSSKALASRMPTSVSSLSSACFTLSMFPIRPWSTVRFSLPSSMCRSSYVHVNVLDFGILPCTCTRMTNNMIVPSRS
mmetsp:Transcript_18555/g.45985  ORF Transcript_18555/g.45985 Transcript_18555/m.45985 type:complete len:204 (+) Transcript_18555:3783-4394(+)